MVYSRNVGLAPNIVSTNVAFKAAVRTFAPDDASPSQDGLSASAPGAIDQDQRLIIAMLADVNQKGVLLPVQRGDTVTITMRDANRAVVSVETLSVTRADPYKRAYAGAVEIMASSPA